MISENVKNLYKIINKVEFKVKNISDAWEIVQLLIDGDINYTRYNECLSSRAGYPIYNIIDSKGEDISSTYISDLGSRLEVNFEDGYSKNIWFS